jgi:hypothetical protein
MAFSGKRHNATMMLRDRVKNRVAARSDTGIHISVLSAFDGYQLLLMQNVRFDPVQDMGKIAGLNEHQCSKLVRA